MTDFPAPVSPLMTLSPEAKRTVHDSTTARFRTVSS